MKKVALSALAAAMMSGVVYADTMTLYTDPKTGQVFTTPAEGRVEMGDFIDAKSVDMQMRDTESKFSEYQDKQSKYVNVKSKAKTLEFSGTHYFGFTSNSYDAKNYSGGDQDAGFELRRNYLQAKAYFNDKDYFRVTMDTTKELESTTSNANMYVKYAYLYLDKVLPYTGVEIGIAHRPWIDYEEHNSWYYRSINKVILEDKFSTAWTKDPTVSTNSVTSVGPDILNSADLGFNLQTKTPYFSSELGLFNGEGYHADKKANNQQNSRGLSAEWRLTAHLLGNGEKVGKYKIHDETYANVSFAGMSSRNHKDNTLMVGDNGEYDRQGYWVHAVYNQPEFLIAAQYGDVKDDLNHVDTANTLYNKEYKMFSINGEVRPMKDWTILARYDKLDTVYSNANGQTAASAANNANTKYNSMNAGDATQIIYGVAYEYSKNLKFIASGKTVNAKDSTPVTGGYTGATATTIGNMLDKQSWMLTTEVEW